MAFNKIKMNVRKKKVFSFNSELYKVTGVQRVLVDIHHAILDCYDARIVGTKSFKNINRDNGISESEYTRFSNPFMFYNSVVILHERKYLILFWVLNHVLFQKIKIIYVHHNIFTDHKRMTILPPTIVSISDRVTENLISFFGAKKECIHKIYNCVKDIYPQPHKPCSKDKIRILYPARINTVKRQIEIYKQLQGKINDKIEILFVGTGPLYDELEKTVTDKSHFRVLGFRNDIYELLQECDYMMLFSKHEGLPITLIEAAMCGTPIICNDVGGNCEIAYNNENAFVVNEWDDLIALLNRLPEIDKENYIKMSKKSRCIYETYFTFDKFRNSYMKLLEQVINE